MANPYWPVLAILVGALVVRHACSAAPTGRSKAVAAALAAGAWLAAARWPAAALPAAVLLAGVGVYVWLHRELTSAGPGG